MSVPVVETDATFKAFPHLNKSPLEYISRSRMTLGDITAEHFSADTFTHRLVQALGETRVIGVKEVLESFEFYARVRRRIRAEHVADLCCGHGLVGLLFGVLQRSVRTVTLIDSRRSKSADVVLESIFSVAPWVEEKVTTIESEVEDVAGHLSPGTSIVAVHACGDLTDGCLDIASQLRSAVAVMPCCYGPHQTRGPEVLQRMLGGHIAVDVGRTYKMEALGYKVDWQFIPRTITPMNRILVGVPGNIEDVGKKIED